MLRSVVTLAKVTLVFLNIWVLAVVLVVSLGHWRVFESSDPKIDYDNSHLIVMRELKEEGVKKTGLPSVNISNFQQDLIKSHLGNDAMNRNPSIQFAEEENPRVNNLRHWCRQQHPVQIDAAKIPSDKLSSILVDEKHKFLFCQVPIVSINDWRKIFLVLNGAVNSTKPSSISGGDVYGKYSKSIKRLNDFPAQKRAAMMKDFYKVIFVRDPLDRLLTAFSTKLVSKGSTYFHKAFGSPIIKRYRKKAKPLDVKNGKDVKFAEFAQYIVDADHEGGTTLNEHWQLFYKQCHPCLVEYDFVGKFETVEEDTDHVLAHLKVKDRLQPPFITDKKSNSQQDLKKHYGTMNTHTLKNLFKVYSADYTLFGYKCPSFLHELLEKGNDLHDY